jgi:pimeloyl-ACP methyl ester carboxylesterase
MSVADSLDHLRADAWLLARRTRRLGRSWQSRLERLADRMPGQAAKASRRLQRRARGLRKQVDDLLPVARGAVIANLFEPVGTGWDQAGASVRKLSRQLASRIDALGERSDNALDRLQALLRPIRQDLGARMRETGSWLADLGGELPERLVPERLEGRGKAMQRAVDRWWNRQDFTEEASKGLEEAAKGVAGTTLWRRITGRSRAARIHPVAWWLGFGLALGLAAVWVRNRRITASLRNVTPQAGTKVNRYPTAFGEMAYRVEGSGPPLVLIHGLGPGAGHHLFERNLTDLAKHFRVFAIDLLGFGLSDKPNITYTGDRMARVIADFLRDVVGGPATVVASGLSSAFAARALAEHPELASNLVLVNPVGEVRRTMGRRLASVLGSVPLLERSVYYGMTDKGRIANRLRSRYFSDPSIADDTMVDQFFANARQPGADRAIRDMIAGRMDLDLACELSNLQVPLSIIWGRHALQPTQEKAQSLVDAVPNACLCVFENSAMFPQTDESELFNQFLTDRFLEQPAKAGGTPASRQRS